MARIDQDEVQKVQKFVNMLNEESDNGAVIVVEGKRDVNALVSIGFNGNVVTLNNFKGVNGLVDNLEKVRKVILMLDMDRKGKYLTHKILTLLRYKGRNVDMFYKKMLAEITKGKVRHVEEIVIYKKYISDISQIYKGRFASWI
ncbi:MAG: 5S rRNA maturation endonuclease (ribonuclease M5) [Candidatus Nitrosomirales archaeon]|jgi:5S rRNA maturation endonuclease (ribonuclease M5)